MFKRLFCKHKNIKVERFYNITAIYRKMGSDYVDIDFYTRQTCICGKCVDENTSKSINVSCKKIEEVIEELEEYGFKDITKGGNDEIKK